MTTTEWVWLFVGVIGLLLVSGALLGGAYLIVRDWRESKTQRGQQDYHPPEPLPPTPAPPLPPAEAVIRWGDQPQYEEMPPPLSGSERIQWGEVQDREWIEVSPIDSVPETDDESVKCPICRHRIDEATEQVAECPQCESLYHQHCLAEMGHKCSNCGEEMS